MPLQDYLLHLLTPRHALHSFFFGAYLVLLTQNPSPFYVSVLVLNPSNHNAHVQKHSTLIGMSETIPLLGQNALLLAYTSGLHLSCASFLDNWSPKKIL